MTHAFRVTAVMVALLCASPTLHGQSLQPVRLKGNQITGMLRWDAVGRKTTDTATCEFVGDDGRLLVTIDFVTQYSGAQPSTPRSEERRVGKECRSRRSTYH